MPLSNFLFQCEFYFHTSEKKKYIPLKNTNTKTVWCLMRCLYFGCKMNFGSPAVQWGSFKRTVLLGAALACRTKRWTFHPLFPGLKVETLWRIGFQSAVAAAQINCPHVMSNARVAPSTRLSKAMLIQLNAVRMTASFLTHEGLATLEEKHCSVRKELALTDKPESEFS